MEISRLLNTGLDEETLALCLQLCENGVNPEALAEVIKELRRESALFKVSHLVSLQVQKVLFCLLQNLYMKSFSSCGSYLSVSNLTLKEINFFCIL